MRKVLLAVAVLLVACMQVARADAGRNAAPADEYFGPYQQSVLEIRNRLNDFDQRDTGAMLDPSVPGELNHLQLAIRDWQQNLDRKASAEFFSRGTAALENTMVLQIRSELDRLKECLGKIK